MHTLSFLDRGVQVFRTDNHDSTLSYIQVKNSALEFLLADLLNVNVLAIVLCALFTH